MMQWLRKWFVVAVTVTLLIAGWQVWSVGQQPGGEKAKQGGGNRLEFEVVSSFDGKYLGDTPGHMGRVGGLTTKKPRIALGDKVYRGEDIVGLVTGLEWNRTNTSLDIEFDPVDHARICVGDAVWLVLDNVSPLKNPGPEVTK